MPKNTRKYRVGLLFTHKNAASFPVVLGDFGCDGTCQACRENSPRTPRAIALGSEPPLVTRIARTGLGTRLIRTVIQGDSYNGAKMRRSLKWRVTYRIGVPTMPDSFSFRHGNKAIW